MLNILQNYKIRHVIPALILLFIMLISTAVWIVNVNKINAKIEQKYLNNSSSTLLKLKRSIEYFSVKGDLEGIQKELSFFKASNQYNKDVYLLNSQAEVLFSSNIGLKGKNVSELNFKEFEIEYIQDMISSDMERSIKLN